MSKAPNPIQTQFDRVLAHGIDLNTLPPIEVFALGCTEGATMARGLLIEDVGLAATPPQFLDGVGMYLVAAASFMCTPEDIRDMAINHMATMMKFCEENGHPTPDSVAQLKAAE